MDDTMKRAFAAAARAFAEVIEAEGTEPRGLSGVPAPGSAESMRMLLSRVAELNDRENRGATAAEMSRFAREAGMDPRGTAGYYREGDKGLLETRSDGRWITEVGRERLAHLSVA